MWYTGGMGPPGVGRERGNWDTSDLAWCWTWRKQAESQFGSVLEAESAVSDELLVERSGS